ncbi:hypothetical protein EJ02DRAFT_442875 [Clathrospora elynae]|uniref:Uncharacterized protein n=1 Tax=Clathrospora elynae TaxID=706981 RepID=A0A6A5SW72_9PLEO|nr:hypothetical protein EJ02DRAFT_442875 [Clathrospora elynae]
MVPRHMCPSLGAIRRSLIADIASTSKCSARALHGSARRLEEQPSDDSPAQPPSARKARSANAFQQIASLQNRRIVPGALGKGSFPSGQTARRNPRSPRTQADEYGFIPEDSPADAQPAARPRLARNAASPAFARGPAPPPGQMVRAPSTLRISRTPVGGNMGGPGLGGGPNLRARDRGGAGAGSGKQRGGPGNSRGDRGPKKRDKKQSGGGARQATSITEISPADEMSDAMIQQLLRLQRKEWDRVPYEPKYAQGSFAASELIHAGRELFKGESPPVKVWGPLERRIGVVGMFGAEAHLKIRRVADGDEKPFGQEPEEDEVYEVQSVEKQEVAVQ